MVWGPIHNTSTAHVQERCFLLVFKYTSSCSHRAFNTLLVLTLLITHSSWLPSDRHCSMNRASSRYFSRNAPLAPRNATSNISWNSWCQARSEPGISRVRERRRYINPLGDGRVRPHCKRVAWSIAGWLPLNRKVAILTSNSISSRGLHWPD